MALSVDCTPKGSSILSIAELWDEWKDKESGKVTKSCADDNYRRGIKAIAQWRAIWR